MRVKYPQLDHEAIALLATRLAELGGSRAKLALDLDVSRSAISQALDGKYPGDTKKLRARIIEKYADQILCPALQRAMAPAECKAARERPLAVCTASRSSVQHWQACQCCTHNPARPVQMKGAAA